MIIAKITQDNLELTIQEINIPYQYSQGLEIEFIRDIKYKDYTLLAFYKLEGDIEAKLMKCNNDIIFIAKDVFKKIGKVSFSFSFTTGEEVIHLGVVEFYVRRAFGNDESILPQEDKNTWMDLIGNIAKDGVDNYWNSFYKEQIDSIVRDINSKVSDTSTYANQANLAKTEARQSATNASSSASSALDSANKAQQHLDNVIEKTDAFNTTVENANNTLDKKILDANTDLDKKVLDANNELDKKISDTNSVMDAKVTETIQQADIATSKATELSQAVEKVNYLEDALDTKLTQPYVSSPVLECGTISDSDEGLLRNLKIYGKCTQNVETDIVPTPSRPIPIISKKINVNNEVVELRSLKESVNLFDLNLLSKTELIPKTGAYRKIDIPLKLKPNTPYTFYYDNLEVPASSWIVLNIGVEDNKGLVGVFNYENKTTESQNKGNKRTVFTTSSTGYVYFNYYANGGDNPHIELWFTKLMDNIMLVEGTTVPSTYVAPTFRDYKIVDHTNKKAWIERNVIQKNLADLTPQKVEHTKFIVTYVYTTIPSGKDGSWNYIFCNNFAVYPYVGFPADIKEGIHVSNYGIYVVLDDKRNITTIEEYKEWVKDNPIIVNYALNTPTTEEIPYLESDTSEFGVSFQDNTSPSPGIPAEIEVIDKLEIKTCGKNLLPSVYRTKDVGSALWTFNGNSLAIKGPSGYRAIDWISGEELTVVGSQAQIKDFYKDKILFNYKGKMKFSMESKINNITDDPDFAFTVEVVSDDLKNSIVYSVAQNGWVGSSYVLDIENCIRGIYVKVWYTGKNRDYEMQNMQLEFGAIATEYKPYHGDAISHTLAKPLVKCGDIADTIDLNSLTRTNNNYFGLLDLANQAIAYGGLVGNYRSWYWSANTMPKPKILKNNEDKNNLLCDRTVANIRYYANGIGETISIYKDGSADFIAVFNINRFINVNEFKRFFIDNPTMVAYPLATPTIEPLEPELIEKLKTLKTFYPITHIISNVPLEFDYKLNMPSWHKVVAGQVEDAKDVIYTMQVQQNNLEIMQLQSALETQYNLDLLKLGGM